MIDCTLEQRDAGWFCTRCGAGPYRLQLNRNCDLQPVAGLGDAIAYVLRKIGIRRKCRGCKRRQKALNAWFPFRAAEPAPPREV